MALCLRQLNNRLPTISRSLINAKRLISSSVTFDRHLDTKVIKIHKNHSQTIQKLDFYYSLSKPNLKNNSFIFKNINLFKPQPYSHLLNKKIGFGSECIVPSGSVAYCNQVSY